LQNEPLTYRVPRPASTVMVVRDAWSAGIEVYMARRSARSPFMPDAYVFPGGALDENDADELVVSRLDRIPKGVEPAFAVAAVRELFEEAGMLLAFRDDGSALRRDELASARRSLRNGIDFAAMLEQNGWRLRGSALTYYSRWITPPGEVARRFDARFFIARAPGDQSAAADAIEMHDGVWISPAQALARGGRGEWMLVFPTSRHLERLAEFTSVTELEGHAEAREPFAVMPNLTAEGVISLPPDLANW